MMIRLRPPNAPSTDLRLTLRLRNSIRSTLLLLLQYYSLTTLLWTERESQNQNGLIWSLFDKWMNKWTLKIYIFVLTSTIKKILISPVGCVGHSVDQNNFSIEPFSFLSLQITPLISDKVLRTPPLVTDDSRGVMSATKYRQSTPKNTRQSRQTYRLHINTGTNRSYCPSTFHFFTIGSCCLLENQIVRSYLIFQGSIAAFYSTWWI